MGFIHGALLWGMGAVSVPIVIHLLNKRRFQRVRWAAMEFLLSAQKKNKRRVRVEHLLVLLLRCLAMALLALAVSRLRLRAVVGIFNPRTDIGPVAGVLDMPGATP